MIRVGLFLLLVLPWLQAGAQARPPSDSLAAVDSLRAWHKRSRPDLVTQFLNSELQEIRRSGKPGELKQVLLTGGSTQAAFGLAGQAEPHLREALELARADEDTLAQLRGLRWLSVAVGRQGRAGEAAELYAGLDELARAAGDREHRGWAQLGLAYDHYLQGRSTPAREAYGRAGRLLEEEGILRGALWAYNGQGLARRQEGDFSGARSCFQRCLDLALRQGDELNEAMALNYLGRLDLLLGDPETALYRLQRASEIHRRNRHHREGLLPRLDMAAARIQLGQHDAADSLLAKARHEAAGLGLRDLELLAVCQQADLRLATARPAAAERLCRRALAEGNFPSPMNRTEVRLRLARALADRDRPREALAELRTELAAEAPAVSLFLRGAALAGALHLACDEPQQAGELARLGLARAREAGGNAFLLPLYSVLGRSQLALGQPDSAWASVEAGLAQWERDRQVPTDPRWRERRTAGAAQLFELGLQLQLERSASAAFDLLQRYKSRTLQERLEGPGGGKAVSRQWSPTVTCAELRRALGEKDRAFLDVFAGRQQSLFCLVTPDTLLVARLPGSGALRDDLLRLTDVLGSAGLEQALPARRLAARLLDFPASFAAELGRCSSLVWCPDGPWHNLPLTLLRGEGEEALLPRTTVLARTPSAGFLTRVGAGARAGARPEDPEGILTITGQVPWGEGPLAGAVLEARWLAHTFRAVQTIFPAGGENSSTETWPAAQVMHFAAHAEVDRQRPWNTAFVLGPEPKHRVRAGEVAGWDLHTELAVLASCSSAGSQVLLGEGMLGMSSAFLAAGVPTVLATLWEVDDALVTLFVQDFYGALARGHTAGRALNLAQEARSRDPRTAAPRHWAGFVLVGDPAARPRLAIRSHGTILAGGLALAAVACLAWGRRLARS